MAILGSDFVIYIDRGNGMEVICYATDCQINRQFDTLEISGPQSRERDFISSYKSYDITVPYLVMWDSVINYLDLSQLADAGTRFPWKATSFDNGGIIFSGTVLITSLDLTSQMRDVMKCDVNMRGCGTFTTQILPINKVVYLSKFDNTILPGCPNPYPIAVFWYDGTLIGPADNADDVINIFNQYSLQNGGYYILTSSVDGGCNFNMQISYNAPMSPDVIYALQGAAFAISPNQDNNEVLSPDQDGDFGLTPIS